MWALLLMSVACITIIDTPKARLALKGRSKGLDYGNQYNANLMFVFRSEEEDTDIAQLMASRNKQNALYNKARWWAFVCKV